MDSDLPPHPEPGTATGATDDPGSDTRSDSGDDTDSTSGTDSGDGAIGGSVTEAVRPDWSGIDRMT
ncbi:hypothetical protein ACFVXQ_08150, partial [Kitasatospora sp. NPDC058263]